MSLEVLLEDPIIKEMMDCSDTVVCLLAFGKEYRPEEQKKLEDARARRMYLRVTYPAKWKALVGAFR